MLYSEEGMVSFTVHATEKIEKELYKFSITKENVMRTVQEPEGVLYDTLTGRYVALNWDKQMAVIYEETGEIVLIITVIYSTTLRDTVVRRRRSGRWI